uniref:Uncharacterized protein n=1 Tax=Anguilla anguilla TaxID=7936 RepID=A0A0E9PT99_ANGAN
MQQKNQPTLWSSWTRAGGAWCTGCSNVLDGPLRLV